MSSTNGNGNGNGRAPDDHPDNRLSRWLSDAERTQTVPQYVAEEVPLPPRAVRWVLGYPAMRVGYGRGRWYPRLVYVLLTAILVSDLVTGIWNVVESRAARHASVRTEQAIKHYIESR